MNWLAAKFSRQRKSTSTSRVRPNRPACRRFSLVDAMILVAGAAVAMTAWPGSFRDRSSKFMSLQALVSGIEKDLGYLLMLSTFLVFVIRLIPPRPPLRLLARQPGAVACFAVVTLQVALSGSNLMEDWVFQRRATVNTVRLVIMFCLNDFGFGRRSTLVVPICWALIALLHRWRPEPGWIDRSGRFLGWSWIIFGLSEPFFQWISFMDVPWSIPTWRWL